MVLVTHLMNDKLYYYNAYVRIVLYSNAEISSSCNGLIYVVCGLSVMRVVSHHTPPPPPIMHYRQSCRCKHKIGSERVRGARSPPCGV